MKHQLHVLLSLLFCASSSFSVAEALETDDAYHIEHVKRPDFIQADTNKDGVINIADRGGWWHNRHHDINKDGKVEFAEYANHYEDTAAARVLRNVVYKTATGQKCLLDIYIPAKQKSPCAPVFYYTHGGAGSPVTRTRSAR